MASDFLQYNPRIASPKLLHMISNICPQTYHDSLKCRNTYLSSLLFCDESPNERRFYIQSSDLRTYTKLLHITWSRTQPTLVRAELNLPIIFTKLDERVIESPKRKGARHVWYNILVMIPENYVVTTWYQEEWRTVRAEHHSHITGWVPDLVVANYVPKPVEIQRTEAQVAHVLKYSNAVKRWRKRYTTSKS